MFLFVLIESRGDGTQLAPLIYDFFCDLSYHRCELRRRYQRLVWKIISDNGIQDLIYWFEIVMGVSCLMAFLVITSSLQRIGVGFVCTKSSGLSVSLVSRSQPWRLYIAYNNLRLQILFSLQQRLESY